MKRFFLVVATVLGLSIAASAANYSINDSDIDALIENATEVGTMALDVDSVDFASAAGTSVISAKNDVVAVALCFILGGFGIHRHYMGTSKFMWVAYTFTFGGVFGIVPLVDFIVMVVDLVTEQSFSKYYGNTKFLMWI